MIVLDTSGLLAAIDAGQPSHAAAATTLAGSPGPFLLSPFVLAELDYLLATRVGREAQEALLAQVEGGAYRVEPFAAEDVGVARSVIARYRDLDIGLTDASIVVLAHRHGTLDVLTLDERHFRVLRSLDGRPFRILPADA